MHRSSLASWALIGLLLLLSPRPAAAYGDDAILKDRVHGVTLHAPYGWHLHRQNGYPALRALLVSKDGRSTITLTVGHLDPGQSLQHYVRANCRAMTQVGILVKRCGEQEKSRPAWMRVDAGVDRMLRKIEQYYRADGGVTFILTLSAPAGEAKERSVDLWRVLDSLVVAPRNTERPKTNSIRGTMGTSSDKARPILPEGDSLPELEGAPLESAPLDEGGTEEPKRSERDEKQ